MAIAPREQALAESHLSAAPYTMLNLSTPLQAARNSWYWGQLHTSSAFFVPGDNPEDVTGNFPVSPFVFPEQYLKDPFLLS